MGTSNFVCNSEATMPVLTPLEETKRDNEYKESHKYEENESKHPIELHSFNLMRDVMNENTVQYHPTRSVIIPPRQYIKEEELDQRFSTVKTATSTPTSVIVNHKQAVYSSPNASTQSVFLKENSSIKKDVPAESPPIPYKR